MVADIMQSIGSDADVVAARQRGRALAAQIGFTAGDQTVIAAAISEIARNILQYAKSGEVRFSILKEAERTGLRIVARDSGPGIRDIGQALADGYSTSGGLGLGLPGARRLMDSFDVTSERGNGTVVDMKKWKP